MASCSFPYSATINHRHPLSHAPPPICNWPTTTTNSMAFGFCSSKVNLRPSFHFRRNSRSGTGSCQATGPKSEPPSKKQPPQSSGVTTLTRFQDSLQIFFAVLFWMSLFFWSCSWGGGNGGSRPNKASRFKK